MKNLTDIERQQFAMVITTHAAEIAACVSALDAIRREVERASADIIKTSRAMVDEHRLATDLLTGAFSTAREMHLQLNANLLAAASLIPCSGSSIGREIVQVMRAQGRTPTS